MSTRRLSFPTMASYGFGQVGEALVTTGFGTFLLFYYNQVLGVSGTYTGMALAIALVIDAATDPLAGAVSDRLRSRWGRRHPFIMFSVLPLALCFFCIFNPPAGLSELALFVWLTTFTVLTRLSLTFYSVPHLALGAEMASDYNQRSTMFSFNLFFAAVGGAVGGAVALRLFFPTTAEFSVGLLSPDGYAGFSQAFAGMMVLAIVVCVVGTWREIPHLPTSGRALPRFTLRQFAHETLSAFSNPSFRAIFFGMMLSTLMLAIESVLGPYIGVHFWGLTTEQLSLLPIFSVAGLLVGMLLVSPITGWLDKKRTLMYCAFLSIINGNMLIVLRLFDAPWFPDNGSVWIMPLVCTTTFIGASMAPPIFGNLNSMFADIVDEHELNTGERREGIIFAARSFLIKVVQSVGIILGGIIIDLIAFPRGAGAGTVAEGVLWNLGFLQGPATSIFTFIGVMLYAGYRLDRGRHAQIVQELSMKQRDNAGEHAA